MPCQHRSPAWPATMPIEASGGDTRCRVDSGSTLAPRTARRLWPMLPPAPIRSRSRTLHRARARRHRSARCSSSARRTTGRSRPAAGPRAIDRYLEYDEQRRLMQSLKSFLASRSFKSTRVFDRTLSLEDLIGQIVTPLRQRGRGTARRAAPARGRRPAGPVRERQRSRRREASPDAARGRDVGRPASEVTFEYEPVAAAYHYGAGPRPRRGRDDRRLRRRHQRLLPDSCRPRAARPAKMRPVTSSQRRYRHRGRCIRTRRSCVSWSRRDSGAAPCGRSSSARQCRCPTGSIAISSAGITSRSCAPARTLGIPVRGSRRRRSTGADRGAHHVVENDLGYPLYHAVQRTKQALSVGERGDFEFEVRTCSHRRDRGRATTSSRGSPRSSTRSQAASNHSSTQPMSGSPRSTACS